MLSDVVILEKVGITFMWLYHPAVLVKVLFLAQKQHKILGWLLAEFVRPFVLTYAATITWLDSGGQRSRSQQATAVKSCAHHIS